MGKKKTITIYTDGSSLGNPGPGGWGSVLIYGKHRKELSGGFRRTTNNRMEILAVIEALKALNTKEKYIVKLHTDSSYVVNSMTKGWIEKWQAKNWIKKGKPVINSDLWKQLLIENEKHDIEYIWVKAHVGITENEICDKLAKEAASYDDLPADIGYENANNINGKGLFK